MKIMRRGCLVVLACLLLVACSSIDVFNQKAYEQATALKAESLLLIDKAGEPYAQHAKEAEALRLNLAKAYEYAKGRPKNDEITRQWAILIDPSRHAIGGLLARWQSQKKLSPASVRESKGVISDQFDQIIELESGKRKPDTGKDK